MYEQIRGMSWKKRTRGKVVVIDVSSGDYEIGDERFGRHAEAFRATAPCALTWGERVGYPAMYTIRRDESPSGSDDYR